jgi:NADH dehydrogenase
VLHGSGLDVTVLRPAVIYGRGDDMITQLVKMIRFSPVFPIVGRGGSLLQPVDVRDVAAAVVAALRRPAASGRTYDVVGPERHTLRRVVEMVAAGVDLPLHIVPTPIAFMRPAVAITSAVSARALSTPAQLTSAGGR